MKTQTFTEVVVLFRHRRSGRSVCGVALVAVGITLFGLLGVGGNETAQGGNGAVKLELVAAGFNSPVHLESPRDGSGRRFIVDRAGTVHVLMPDGTLLDEPFLDVTRRLVSLAAGYDERGLLGFALHPDFAANGRLFVHYSAPRRAEAPLGWDHTGRIAEFRVSDTEPNRVDLGSERVVLEVDQPQSNHNGGTLAFGPDGYLYIALGDGGGANDVGMGHPPAGNGQDVTTLLGSILRINVDATDVDAQDGDGRYGIPADNPFFDGPGRAEIYAWGFRNPYRMSFDNGGDGALYVADVGQDLWEEVNVVTGPGNFGWRVKEGDFWFDASRPQTIVTAGPTTGSLGERFVDPIFSYAHPGVATDAIAGGGDVPRFGISVIGGYVYRGDALPSLYGSYVFGDWSTSFGQGAGKLLVASMQKDGSWEAAEVMRLDVFVIGFGQDADGELYVLTTERAGPTGRTGSVYKIVPSGD